MKTNLFMALAFAFLMLFAACTEEKIIYVEKDSDVELLPGEGVIKISLSNDLQTKAARPIGSSEPGNNVNRIAFKIISNDSDNPDRTEGVSIQLVNSNGEPSNTHTVVDNVICLSTKSFSTSETLYVKFSDLPKGVWGKIIAYGYNCDSGTETAFPYNIEVPKEYLPLLECRNLSNDMITDGGCTIEEIFAGSDDIYINEFGKFITQPKIVLKRQVAGLMAYLEKVPAFVDKTKVAKITIRTYAPIVGFKFPSEMLEDNDALYNGIVLNGYTQNIDLLTFDLSQLATNYGKVTMGETYTFETGKNFADEMDGINIANLALKKNTLFGSRFLLPYAGNWDYTTLAICFLDEDDNLLETVNLRNGGDSSSPENSEYYKYNIKCNHFYSIGTKGNVDDTDTDNPLDITLASGYDIAEVTITDQWDDVYGLVTPWTPASSSD